tara:strand:+ start:36 stop:419 length:384 start_codon:yes stop_codon:yes gene_type:complete
MNIWYSTGELSILSNLAERPFTDKDGREYVSVEHAYQSWKAGVFNEYIYRKPWKAGSKFTARGTKTEGDWNISLMESIMRLSFKDIRNTDAVEVLVGTGDSVLTHNQDRGVWKLRFPKLLIKIRKEL